MRAVVLREGDMVLDNDAADPSPGAGQVLIGTRTCGICGTDLHARHHLNGFLRGLRSAGTPLPTDPRRDVVFGHEFCGEILDYGPQTTGALRAGTLVVGLPYVTGARGPDYVGFSNQFPGGFAERLVATERLLFPVPNGLAAEDAALTEPFAIGEHAVARAQVAPRSSILVVGCGPIGLAVIAALKLRGVGPIVATDYSPGRRRLAEQVGADEVVDAMTETQAKIWSRVKKNRDQRAVAFECVGRPGVVQKIIDDLPRNGMVVVVGASLQESYIDQSIAFNKEIDICFSQNYRPQEFRATLHNIADGRIAASAIRTGIVGLEGLPEAFDALADPERHAKIIVRFDRP